MKHQGSKGVAASLGVALLLAARLVSAGDPPAPAPEPPWYKRILFDADASLPRLSDGTTDLGGDLLLGYRGDSWGVSGRGGASSYRFVSTERRDENRRLEGGLDAWLNTGGKDARFRLDGRLGGRGARYRTRTVQPSAEALFGQQVSTMARGVVSVGARYEDAPRGGLALTVGAAAQHEVYQRVDVGEVIDAGQASTTTLLLEGRLRGHLALLDDALRLRLTVDASRFHIRRDALGVTAGNALVVVRAGVDSTQLTMSDRLFIDLEVLRFLIFVPTAHAGLDVVSLHVEGADAATTVIPLGGVGIRSDAF